MEEDEVNQACSFNDEVEETTKTTKSSINGQPSPKKNISCEVESYLDKVNSYISQSFDPKLKREHKKLADLLLSYKRLNDKLKKKYEDTGKSASSEALKKFPEIYAILHPEMFVDIRETEKEKLVSKFAKKNFHNEPILPCHKSPQSYNLYDLRQIEKDRFARVIAAAPSRFHNLFPQKVTARHLPANVFRDSVEVEDVREKEKDRLARIFATSISKKKNSTRYNCRISLNVENKVDSERNGGFDNSNKSNGDASVIPTRDSVDAHLNTQCGMVRTGEYSPLNTRDNPQGKHLLSFGEYEERRKLSLERRKKEYRDYLTQAKQVAKTKMDASMSTEQEGYSLELPRYRSISTQTETDSVSLRATAPISIQAGGFHEGDSSSLSPTLHPNTTPREKLLSDLHGSSDFFSPDEYPTSSGDDARSKQIAYAEALRAQIEEKKRLEALQKQKEKEEEEMFERKTREQQEKLQKEYQKEQIQRLDWIQQRATQEELLRQRLQEMEIQTQELKKEERRKKRLQSHHDDIAHEELNQGDVHNVDNQPDVNIRYLEQITRTPLLDADPQNVLSDKYYNHHSPRILEVSPQNQSAATSPRLPVAYNPLYLSMAGDKNETAERQRPVSPVIPALRTESLLKKNSQLLYDKWMEPRTNTEKILVEPRLEGNDGSMRRADTILTQLGAFRRQLQLEHIKMQQRLETQPSQ